MRRSLYHPSRKLIRAKGLESIDAQVATLRQELDTSRATSADRDARSVGCCSGCSVTDDVTRQHDLLRARIETLLLLRRQATKINELPEDRSELGIGHVATFRYRTRNGSKSKDYHVQFEIVGLHEEDPLSAPIRLSYQAPLAQAFLEMRVGTVEENILLAGKPRTVTLTAIRWPNSRAVIRKPPEENPLRAVA